jgi:carboxymethylenebutenolidase
MKKLGKTYEPVIYKGAGHGFMRTAEAPDAKEVDKTAHEAAWKRFLQQLSALK